MGTQPAQAEPSAHDRVVELVTESAGHYEAGRFRQAIELLREALKLEQDPTIQYNLARAFEGLGDLDGAITAYASYLAQLPEADDRGSVEQRLLTLRRQRSERDKRRQTSPTTVPAEESTQEPEQASVNWVPWGTAAAGTLVLAAGLVFGIRSRSAHDQAVDAEFAADAEDKNRDARSFATIANVALLSGGLLVLGGVSWGLATWPAAEPPRAARFAGPPRSFVLQRGLGAGFARGLFATGHF